jgi:hypothetical protein
MVSLTTIPHCASQSFVAYGLYASYCIPSPEPHLPGADDYRLLAGQIREVARHTRLALARRELARIAARYDERAALLDNRQYCW